MKPFIIIIIILLPSLSIGQHGKKIGTYKSLCDYVKANFKNQNCRVENLEKFMGYSIYGQPDDDTARFIFRDRKHPEINYFEISGGKSNGIFYVNGQKFDLIKDISNTTVSDLNYIHQYEFYNIDGMSSNLHKYVLKDKEYIVVSSYLSDISGKGPFTTNFCIFDIGNPDKIHYYFMQSTEGCEDNIGDFDNDGNLDILVTKIAKETSPYDWDYTINMYSLMKGDFVILEGNYSKVNWKYVNFRKGSIFELIDGHWDF